MKQSKMSCFSPQKLWVTEPSLESRLTSALAEIIYSVSYLAGNHSNTFYPLLNPSLLYHQPTQNPRHKKVVLFDTNFFVIHSPI